MDDFAHEPISQSEDGLTAASGDGSALPAWMVTDTTADDAGADAHDNLWWYSDGTVWDLGPAEFDADGDGLPDSLTSEVDGSSAILTDSDGDGRVDRMSVLRADGRVAAWELEASGEDWNPTALGRIE